MGLHTNLKKQAFATYVAENWSSAKMTRLDLSEKDLKPIITKLSLYSNITDHGILFTPSMEITLLKEFSRILYALLRPVHSLFDKLSRVTPFRQEEFNLHFLLSFKTFVGFKLAYAEVA